MDKISKQTLRKLKHAGLLLGETDKVLEEAFANHLRVRAYPGPEAREIRRKVESAIALLEELIGEG